MAAGFTLAQGYSHAPLVLVWIVWILPCHAVRECPTYTCTCRETAMGPSFSQWGQDGGDQRKFNKVGRQHHCCSTIWLPGLTGRSLLGKLSPRGCSKWARAPGRCAWRKAYTEEFEICTLHWGPESNSLQQSVRLVCDQQFGLLHSCALCAPARCCDLGGRFQAGGAESLQAS